MALSTDSSLEYSLGDEELTSTNATIMPVGTTTYTVSSNHTMVTVRKVNDSYRIRYAFTDSSSFTVNVQAGDIVWDISEAKYQLKFSTGGNTFVNYVNSVNSVDTNENDTFTTLLWNGDFKIQ